MVSILSALWWRRIRGLWKLPVERDWLWGKLGLVLLGEAMLNKSLIQFSVDEWGCFPSLLFDLWPNYGGGNEDNGNLLQKVLCTHCHTQCSWLCRGPQLIHASSRGIKLPINRKTCNHFLKSRCTSGLSWNILKNTNVQVLLLFHKIPDVFLISKHV